MNLALADRCNLADMHSNSLIDTPKVSMLVAIASNIENPEVLIAGVLPGAEILLLNDSADSITQISRALAANPAQTLSIVCHGSSGKLDLGNTVLDRHSLPEYQSQLQAWGISELVLYACEVGQDRNFIAQLSEQTGAKVAAAKGKVGNAALGGNWQLEDSKGETLEALAFSDRALQNFIGVLALFSPQVTFAAGNINSIAVGDFNGDSKSDLVTASYSRSNVSVLLGNGSGGFSAETTFAAGNRPLSVAVGDLNGDSNLDLVAVNRLSNNVSVLLGNGSGGFSAQTTFAAGTLPLFVAVGDFNSDSNLDLVTTNAGDDNVSVLLGNGSGGFSNQNTFAVGNGPISVAVGDFNGDSKPDIAVANNSSDNVSVLLGNGSGGFSNQNTFASVIQGAYSVAVGDFNGDSKPDFVTVNSSIIYSASSVRLGNGSGGFSAETTFASIGRLAKSVAVGDFNGDSNLDFVIVNAQDDNVAVRLGNGSGGFSAETFFSVGSIPFPVAVGDFNGDNQPDLAVGNANSNLSVLLNTTVVNLTGIVYSDLNNNGTQNPGENGIPGVVLTANAGGNSFTATTNDSGIYTFSSLPINIGSYTLTETQPIGFLDGIDVVGSGAGGTLLPPDSISNINLSGGIVATGYNFGELLPASLAISPLNIALAEGNAGSSAFSYTVTRSGGLTGSVSATYAVTGTGSNPANTNDFGGVLPSGTVSFIANETSKNIAVNVSGDLVVENDEGFTITLSNPTNQATITAASATGVIQNDDIPGFTITPTSGLVTTEAGGTANFTVKLTSQPTANVTLNLSSSDPTEGYLATSTLTFTPANFNTAQPITVTGIDDLIVDGNIVYAIITAPATSTDPFYSGLNPVDISVTNQDNDTTKIPTPGTTVVPSGGGYLILGTNLANVIFGAATNDTIYGYAGNDYIAGQNGLDYIDGGIGNDTLLGEAGNDTLIGGAGNDTLIGGLGVDNLIGGADIDTFVYTAIAEGGDAISDFAVTEKFLVSQGGFGGGLLPGVLLPSQFGLGAAATTAAQRLIYDSATGILRFDVDGNGAGASSIIATLTGSPALLSSNISVF